MERSFLTCVKELHDTNRPPDFKCCMLSISPQSVRIEFPSMMGFSLANVWFWEVLIMWTFRTSEGRFAIGEGLSSTV